MPPVTLRKALLSRPSSVELAVKIMHTLSGQPSGTVQAERCLVLALCILLELLQCGSPANRRTRLDLVATFFKVLRQNLVHRSFLRSLIKVMKKTELARITRNHTTVLWTPWLEFKSDTERRFRFNAKVRTMQINQVYV